MIETIHTWNEEASLTGVWTTPWFLIYANVDSSLISISASPSEAALLIYIGQDNQ